MAVEQRSAGRSIRTRVRRPLALLAAKKTRLAVVIFGFGSTWPLANGCN